MFGPRAAHVHKMFQDSKASEETLSSISSQMGLMAQLRHINTELKVRQLPGSFPAAAPLSLPRTSHRQRTSEPCLQCPICWSSDVFGLP